MLYTPQQQFQQPQQIVVQQAPLRPKKSGAMIGAMLFSLFAMVLIIVSLMVPWWGAHVNVKVLTTEYNGDIQFGVQTISSTGTLTGFSSSNKTQTVGQYNEDFKTAHNGASSSVAGLLSSEFMMSVIAVVFALLAMLFCLLALLGKIKPSIAGLIIIVAAVIALASSLMFYASLPGAWETDYNTMNQTNPFPGFAGSSSSSNALGSTSTTWGPAGGWYLVLVGMIFLFIAASLAFSAKSGSPALATAVPPQQVVVVQQPQYVSAPQPVQYVVQAPQPVQPAQQYPSQPSPYPQQYPPPQ